MSQPISVSSYDKIMQKGDKSELQVWNQLDLWIKYWLFHFHNTQPSWEHHEYIMHDTWVKVLY